MEGTEHPLEERHLEGCLELSRSANWNQNEADWRLMLRIGRGWGLTLADGTLAASTVVIPYGGFAWVSMVLVLPAHRRQGYASRLLRTAIADLGNRGETAILDATPAGRAVYSQEGFRDLWGFRRFFLRAKPKLVDHARTRVRTLDEKDWPSILKLDMRAFGASRERLLRALALRLPHAALVAEDTEGIAGYLFGRDGREASQLGPLVAKAGDAARALLGAALARTAPPVYVDVVDRDPVLAAWTESACFVFQRPFTRMLRGAGRAPGNENLVYLVAGPELG